MRDDVGSSSESDRKGEAANAPGESVGVNRASRDMADIFAGANGPRRPAGPAVSDPVTPIVTHRPVRSRAQSKAPLFLSLGTAIGAAAAWMMIPSHPVVSLPSARGVERIHSPPPLEDQQPVAVAPVAVRGPAIPFPGTVTGVQTISAGSAVSVPQRARVVPAYYRSAQHVAPRRAKVANDRGPCGAMRRLWLARCMRPQVLAADRELREAYENAVRAGVDRDMLVAYRNRWNRVRGDAVYDPTYVTATFQQMAHRLDAASSRADY